MKMNSFRNIVLRLLFLSKSSSVVHVVPSGDMSTDLFIFCPMDY